MKKVLLIAALIGAAILILKRKKVATWYYLVTLFLLKFEGFRASPYWDVSRWSWGYGTPAGSSDKAKKPPGMISRKQALLDAYKHVEGDLLYLKPLIKVELQPIQWAALLSFAYNLGQGNADNLAADINTANWVSLGSRWVQYNKAGGKVLDSLTERRKAEWAAFSKGKIPDVDAQMLAEVV